MARQVLGLCDQSLPLASPIHCFCVSRITYLKCHNDLFSRLPEINTLVLGQDNPNIPHRYSLSAYLYKVHILNVNYPVPTTVREICTSPFCFLSNTRDFPILVSPASLIYHQWNSYHLLISSLIYCIQ